MKIVKNILIGILGVIFFGFVISMTVLLLNFNKYGVTEFGETSLIIIDGKISSDKYKKGDLVLVEEKAIKDIKVGDEVFAYKVASDRSVSIDLGKVGEVHVDDDAISYENGNTYAMKYVAGTGGKVYHNIGTFLSIVESKWGFLFIVILPSFLVFIYELYAIIVEVKYGKQRSNS